MNIPNYHAIEVTYKGATNHRGSRVTIKSLHFAHDSFSKPYDYAISGDCKQQGAAILNNLGYTIVCSADTLAGYIVFVKEIEPIKTRIATR